MPELFPEVVAEPESALVWGARTLKSQFQHKVGKFSEVDGLDPKLVVMRVEAAAEAMVQHQVNSMDEVLKHVRTMISLGLWKGVLFLEHISYDETPMDIRVRFRGQSHADRQVSKVLLIKCCWCMILQELPSKLSQPDADNLEEQVPRHFVLESHFSPQLRSAAATNAETVHEGPQHYLPGPCVIVL